MEFKTHYGNTPALGEINTAPSQTIPEQSFTVREIMTRFSQGLGWTGPKVPVYDGGEDPTGGINLEALDLSERQEMLQMVNDRIIHLRHTLAENAKPKKLRAPQATIQNPNNTDNPAPVNPIDNPEG